MPEGWVIFAALGALLSEAPAAHDHWLFELKVIVNGLEGPNWRRVLIYHFEVWLSVLKVVIKFVVWVFLNLGLLAAHIFPDSNRTISSCRSNHGASALLVNVTDSINRICSVC